MILQSTINSLLKKLAQNYSYSANMRIGYLPRQQMVELAMDFCRYNHVEGDYLEFGVWRGDTFQHAYHAAKGRGLSKMRFFAFDSFEGFSEPQGKDNIGLIEKGSRAFSLDQFNRYMEQHKVDVKEITTVPGWFSESLTQTTKKKYFQEKGKLHKAAVIYVDCDLYEPAKETLDFITDLITDGTIIMFDDWFFFKAHPERSERKAFFEWQKKHPEITATDYANFGWHGKAFILNTPL